MKAARTALGLWHPSLWDSPAQLQHLDTKTLHWSGREVKLTYFQLPSLLPTSAEASLREWVGRLSCERTGALLGTVELMLLRRTGRSTPPEELVAALRDDANATASDWSNALARALDCGERLDEALSLGPLVLLSRLEICPVAAPKGLGAWAARRVLSLMAKRHGARLAFLKPFPLQYEFAEQAISRRMYDSRWLAFDEARSALSLHYAKHLAARPLGGEPDATWLLADLKA